MLRRLVLSIILLSAALAAGAFVDALNACDRAASSMFALRVETANGTLITFMQGVSLLGGGIVRWIVALLLSLLLWRYAGRRAALLLAFAALAANLASSLLKILYARPRPELVPHLDHVTSFSYPSGHATSVAAIAIALALLAPPSWRGAAAAFSAVAIALTIASRVMLGVHWPSDVLGGTLLGAGVALGATAIARPNRRDRDFPLS